MARLTWQNVAAPDFSGAMDSLRTFGQLFDSAISKAQGTIGAIDADRSQEANKQVLLAALAEQDPTAYKTKLANGTFLSGVDPRRVSLETAQNLSNRVGTLLNQQLTETNLARTNYEFGREKDVNAARDAAAPLQQQMLILAGKGDFTGAQKVFDSNREVFGKLGYNDFSTTLRDSQNLANDRQQFDQSDWRFGRSKIEAGRADADYNRSEAVSNLLAEVAPFVDPADKLKYINSKSGVDDRVRASALQAVGGYGAASASPLAVGLGGGGGTNDDPYNVVLGNGKFGNPSSPLTSMSLGQVIDFGKNVLIPNSKAAGVGRDSRGLLGSSAVGAYQITQSTLKQYAPKVLGAAWQDAQFTPEVQDKIAEAIFNDHKGSASALAGQWASLTQAEAEQVRKMPWAQARQVIAAGESSATPASLVDRTIDRTNRQFEQASALNEVNAASPAALDIARAVGQTGVTPFQAAAELAKAIPGVRADWAEQQIMKLMASARKADPSRNVNASMAAAAIRHAAGGQAAREGWGRLIPDALAGNTIGDDLVVDLDAAKKSLLEYNDGQLQAVLNTNANQQAASALEAQAQAAVTAAQQRLLAKQQLLQRTGGKGSLAQEMLDLQQATEQLNAITGAIDDPRSALRLSGRRNIPAAPEVVARQPAPSVQRRTSGGRGASQSTWNAAISRANAAGVSFAPEGDTPFYLRRR